MPPIYLFDTFVPFLIGVPLIIIAALYGSFRAIGPGGDVDTGYDNMDRAMRPLGLSLTERPKVRMVPPNRHERQHARGPQWSLVCPAAG